MPRTTARSIREGRQPELDHRVVACYDLFLTIADLAKPLPSDYTIHGHSLKTPDTAHAYKFLLRRVKTSKADCRSDHADNE